MKNYLKLLKFLKGQESRFSVAIVFIILSSLFEGVQLTFILPVVDRIFENKPIVIPNKVPAFIAHVVDKLNSMDPHTLFWMTPLCFMILFSIKQVLEVDTGARRKREGPLRSPVPGGRYQPPGHATRPRI